MLHTDVTWLSGGKFLHRFRDLFPEIKQFHLVAKHAEYNSDKNFQDFASLEPAVAFMCYRFRDDVEVDSLASKIATLFQLNSSRVADEILTLQTDIQQKGC